jgi:hypothetical protein
VFKRVVVASALLCGVCAWQAASALSWYSQITASMSCSGTVSWTASAWPGPTPASRENPDVVVWASDDNGATFTQIAQGAFDQADNFSFSGTFPAAGASSVIIKVHEEANWPGGGGDTPGPPHFATASWPATCSTPQPHTGYCDSSGKFWSLTVAQTSEPPYSSLGLRPANVNPQTGILYCASPAPTQQVTPPPITPPPGKHKKPAKPITHKKKPQKPQRISLKRKPHHHRIPKRKPKPHPPTLPWTK